MEPEIRYTTTADGVSIAYCESGEGTPFVETQPPPWNNIEAEFREWEWHRIVLARRLRCAHSAPQRQPESASATF